MMLNINILKYNKKGGVLLYICIYDFILLLIRKSIYIRLEIGGVCYIFFCF